MISNFWYTVFLSVRRLKYSFASIPFLQSNTYCIYFTFKENILTVHAVGSTNLTQTQIYPQRNRLMNSDFAPFCRFSTPRCVHLCASVLRFVVQPPLCFHNTSIYYCFISFWKDCKRFQMQFSTRSEWNCLLWDLVLKKFHEMG